MKLSPAQIVFLCDIATDGPRAAKMVEWQTARSLIRMKLLRMELGLVELTELGRAEVADDAPACMKVDDGVR